MAMNKEHSLASLHNDLVNISYKKSDLFWESIIEKYTCKSLKITPPKIHLDVLCADNDWTHSTHKFLAASLKQQDWEVDQKTFAQLKKLGQAKNKQYDKIKQICKESEAHRKLLGLEVPIDEDSDNDSLSVADLLYVPKPKENRKVITPNGIVEMCGLKLRSHDRSDSANAALSNKKKTTTELPKKNSSHSFTTKLLGTCQTESQKEQSYMSADMCEVQLAKQLRNGKTYDKYIKKNVIKKKLKPTIKRKRTLCLRSDAIDPEDVHKNLDNLNLADTLHISLSKLTPSSINNANSDDSTNNLQKELNLNFPKKCIKEKDGSGCKLQKRDSCCQSLTELFNTCQTESQQKKEKTDQVNQNRTFCSTSRCEIKLTKQLRNGKTYDKCIKQDGTKIKLKSSINKNKSQTHHGLANDPKDMCNNLETLCCFDNLPISLTKVTLNPIDKANRKDPFSLLNKESHSHEPKKNSNDAFNYNINNNLYSSLTSVQSGQHGAGALPLREQILNNLDMRNNCVASSQAAEKSPVKIGSQYFVLHKDGSHFFMDDLEKIETYLKSNGFEKNETFISDLNNAFERVTSPVDIAVELTDISHLFFFVPEKSSIAEMNSSKEKSFSMQEIYILALSNSQVCEKDLNQVGVVTRGSLSGLKHKNSPTVVQLPKVNSKRCLSSELACSESINENVSCSNIVKNNLNLSRKAPSNSHTEGKLGCSVVTLQSDKDKSASSSHSIINASLEHNDDGNRGALVKDNTKVIEKQNISCVDDPSVYLDAGRRLNNSITETVPESVGNVEKIAGILKRNQPRSCRNQHRFESSETNGRIGSKSCTTSDKPCSSFRKPTSELQKSSLNPDQNCNAYDNPVASSHYSEQLNSRDSHSNSTLCSDQNNDEMVQTTDIPIQQAMNSDKLVNISDQTIYNSNLPNNLPVQLSYKTNQAFKKSNQLNELVQHGNRSNISTYNCDNLNDKSGRASVRSGLHSPKPCKANGKSEKTTPKFDCRLHNADQQCDKHDSSTHKSDDISHQTDKQSNKSDRCNSKSYQLRHKPDVSRNTSDQSTSNFDHLPCKSVQFAERSNGKFPAPSSRATLTKKIPVRTKSFRKKPMRKKLCSKSFQLVSESDECSDKSDQLISTVNPHVSECSVQPSTSPQRRPKLTKLSSNLASSSLQNTLTGRKRHFRLLDSDDSSDSEMEEYSAALKKNEAASKHHSNLPSLLSLCTMKESFEETISTAELLETLLF